MGKPDWVKGFYLLTKSHKKNHFPSLIETEMSWKIFTSKMLRKNKVTKMEILIEMKLK